MGNKCEGLKMKFGVSEGLVDISRVLRDFFDGIYVLKKEWFEFFLGSVGRAMRPSSFIGEESTEPTRTCSIWLFP